MWMKLKVKYYSGIPFRASSNWNSSGVYLIKCKKHSLICSDSNNLFSPLHINTGLFLFLAKTSSIWFWILDSSLISKIFSIDCYFISSWKLFSDSHPEDNSII